MKDESSPWCTLARKEILRGTAATSRSNRPKLGADAPLTAFRAGKVKEHSSRSLVQRCAMQVSNFAQITSHLL